MSYGNPNHSAAFKLFNYCNLWMIPSNAAMTSTTLELAGYVAHPNPAKQREMADSLSTVYITTARAAMYAAEGVTLAINDPERAKDIFAIISEHLIDWREYLKRGDPTRQMVIPLDGLIEFHQLATGLIFVARGHGYYDKPVIERRFRRAQFNSDLDKTNDPSQLVVDEGVIKDIVSLAAGYGIKPSVFSSDFLLGNEGEQEASRGAIPNVRTTI